MPASRLTEAEQRRLIDAATHVAKQAATGTDPTEALAGAIDEFDLNQGEADVVAQNYNVGSQVDQWQTYKTAAERLQSFPLADSTAAMAKAKDRVAKVAAAVGDGWDGEGQVCHEWNLSPRDLRPAPTALIAKTAARITTDEPKPETPIAFSALAERLRYAERKVADAHIEVKAADIRFGQAIADIERWFLTPAGRKVARASLVAACDQVFEKVACAEVRVPASSERQNVSFAELAAPLALVRKAAAVLHEAQAIFAKRAEAEQAYAEIKKAFDDRVREPGQVPVELPVHPLRSTKPAPVLKTAIAMPALVTAQLPSMANAFGGIRDKIKQEGKDEVRKTLESLEDVSQQQRLAGIELQTMLAEMMSDPESPAAGLPYEDVLSKYNQLVSQAPALASRPSVFRPYLLQSLSGQQSTFDLQQALEADEKLRRASGFNPYHQLLGKQQQ